MKGLKDHYEEYWKSKRFPDTFEGYERNWVLPRLFRKDEKILDIACGDGAVGEHLINEYQVEVFGVDISQKAVAEARKRGIKAKVHNIEEEKLPFPPQSFDVVFWGDNVEHLFKPEFVLKEIRRVLKNRGRLILSCPNMGYWRYRLYYLFHGRLPDTEWSGSAPWSWGHIRFFNHNILKDFLATEDFVVKKTFGISRRKPDFLFKGLLPKLFGMIFVIEAS